MSVLVTGGTGFVGRFLVAHFLEAGFEVAVAGRTPPADGTFAGPVAFLPLTLDPDGPDPAALAGVEWLVHAAFDHVPGRYRGGEGDRPDRFVRLNLDGSVALVRAARAAGAKACVFLSSRAVYGDRPHGAPLREDTPPRPDTLYGEIKRAAEERLATLAAPGFSVASLRVTGVYGPPARGRPHKWTELFADFLAGRPIEPRCGTEVHGDDVARAAALALGLGPEAGPQVLNVSDLMIDRRDLLAILREVAGSSNALPPAADPASRNAMSTDRIRALGWTPGGRPLFERTVRQLARDFVSGPESG